jgi:hypothetical protein
MAQRKLAKNLGCPHSESSMPLQPREFCNWLYSTGLSMQNFTDAEWRPPECEVFADDGRSLGRLVPPYLYWVVGI